jgi:hypothetical protein
MNGPSTDRTPAGGLTLLAAGALCLLIAASPATAATAAGGGAHASDIGASVAKKKKKKKRKKHRPAPVAPAPSNVAQSPVVPVGCSDDPFEPNDAAPAATTLAITDPTATTAAVRCPSNSDFFVVSIPAGDYNNIVVDPDTGFDAKLAVYDSTGTLVGTPADASPAGGNEFVSYNNIAGGATTYYVEVSSATAASTGAYTIVAYST